MRTAGSRRAAIRTHTVGSGERPAVSYFWLRERGWSKPWTAVVIILRFVPSRSSGRLRRLPCTGKRQSLT